MMCGKGSVERAGRVLSALAHTLTASGEATGRRGAGAKCRGSGSGEQQRAAKSGVLGACKRQMSRTPFLVIFGASDAAKAQPVVKPRRTVRQTIEAVGDNDKTCTDVMTSIASSCMHFAIATVAAGRQS
ncbi:hypothetical protein EJ04DRAFT_93470 [Polyplosphaeria fusca]|uniref:Uncharacterized protein n=1 Tax=Polyplosphaeria fusca TaxID=682080 RepID=A0A9P4UU66_9PLEO|nr:hypothetical protein EJ04DRAFT_93470 [Polyplosphaeria fusca]